MKTDWIMKTLLNKTLKASLVIFFFVAFVQISSAQIPVTAEDLRVHGQKETHVSDQAINTDNQEKIQNSNSDNTNNDSDNKKVQNKMNAVKEKMRKKNQNQTEK